MRTFLVTGGAGFIGSHIVAALVARGDRVRVVDNLSTGNKANLAAVDDQIEFLDGDICDAERMAECLTGVDCVFHTAALASVPRSVANPLDTHRDCVTGTVILLDAARRAGVRRVVYSAMRTDRSSKRLRRTPTAPPPGCGSTNPRPADKPSRR